MALAPKPGVRRYPGSQILPGAARLAVGQKWQEVYEMVGSVRKAPDGVRCRERCTLSRVRGRARRGWICVIESDFGPNRGFGGSVGPGESRNATRYVA